MNNDKWYYTQDAKTFGPFQGQVIQQMLNAGVITKDTEVAQEGDGEWRRCEEVQLTVPTPAGSNGIISSIANKVSQASGLEKLEGFSLGHLFSQVFKKHTPAEIEEHFVAGTEKTTPPLNEVNAAWPTPWAFVRLLFLSLIASVGFYYALGRFENPILIPGWIFVGCFGIPFAVLIFFMEVNVLRNVSFYRILSLMFLGGLLSLIFSLFLFEYTKLDHWLGAMSAGIIEEAGKIVAVIYFTRKWLHYGWTLNGLLFGAAVGTGFSAFESAGYVFVALAEGEDFGTETTMILRAFLSPFTHTIWTAAIAAALWRVKRDKPFEWGMLSDWRFLRIFIFVALLHLAWNSPLTIPVVGGALGFLGLRVIFGLVAWMIIFPLIQEGLREVRVAQQESK
jgi:RsiW-degrading membrane proteinase PrsW (M82 family)